MYDFLNHLLARLCKYILIIVHSDKPLLYFTFTKAIYSFMVFFLPNSNQGVLGNNIKPKKNKVSHDYTIRFILLKIKIYSFLFCFIFFNNYGFRVIMR